MSRVSRAAEQLGQAVAAARRRQGDASNAETGTNLARMALPSLRTNHRPSKNDRLQVARLSHWMAGAWVSNGHSESTSRPSIWS
jgi:hypothetical protein